VLPSPFIAAHLTEAMGGNIEPFLFVVALWWLRRRPLWFGALLAAGFLTREFVAYVVPVLVIGDLWQGRLTQRDALLRWAAAAVAFFVVWEAVAALKPLADLRGPGTRGSVETMAAGSQLSNLADRVAVRPAEIPGRLSAFVTDAAPRLVGARAIDDGVLRQGRDWLWPLILGAAAIGVARLAWLARRGPPFRIPPLAWFLMGVGSVAVVVFLITRPVENAPLRYVLLGLYLPIGLTAAWLAVEPLRIVRAAVLVVVAACAVSAASDHVGLVRRVRAGEIADPMGTLARALEARGTRVARAEYWRAYRLTFLAQERVIVASTDYVRIEAYQRIADEAAAPVLRDRACDGGEPVAAGWYLCAR
jgi:hypothetical protein